jgi:hypothetical protein
MSLRAVGKLLAIAGVPLRCQGTRGSSQALAQTVAGQPVASDGNVWGLWATVGAIVREAAVVIRFGVFLVHLPLKSGQGTNRNVGFPVECLYYSFGTHRGERWRPLRSGFGRDIVPSSV